MPDDVIADSSTAAPVPAEPAAPAAPPPIETWTSEQRSHWRLTGETPQPKPADPAPATEPSEPDSEEDQVEEAHPDSDPEDKQGEPAKKKSAETRKAGLQREIQDLVRKRNELRGNLDQLVAGVKPAETPPAGGYVFNPQLRPQRTQFASDDDYVEAMADWKYQTRRIEETHAQAVAAEKAAAEALEADWVSRREAAKQRQKDWAEVVAGAQIPISPDIRETLMTDENGPELVYALAKDKNLAQRIFAMSPMAAGRELGRMSAEIAKNNHAARPPAMPTVTSAPNPPRELNAKASKSGTAWEQALKDRDFSTWKRLEDARVLKK